MKTQTEPAAINSPRNYTPSQPVRDEAYRQWVRSLPCLVCATRRRIEAAHTGPHGLGQKASDLNCIPLCRRHHADLHHFGIRRFSELHGRLNIAWSVELLNRRWKATEVATKAYLDAMLALLDRDSQGPEAA